MCRAFWPPSPAAAASLGGPDLKKIKKQLDYANKNHIPFVGVIGDDEIASKSVQLKNMQNGEQLSVSQEGIAEALK